MPKNGNGGRRPVLLTWQGPGATRLESARLVRADTRLRAIGRVIAGAAGSSLPYFASYELAVDDAGAASRLSVFTTTAEEERQVTLSRSGEGVWLVEHKGDEARRLAFDGAVDVDVLDCVLFNCLPVRRLDLHRQARQVDLQVVCLSLPDLSVEVRTHTYRTLSTSTDGAVVEFRSGQVGAEITVDQDGLVLDYPGYARRV